MTCRPAIAPVRIRSRDDSLHCDRVRVVGYRVTCDCGYRSTVTRTVADARALSRQHRHAAGS